ncbi:MAG TPA: ribosome maturation factor RimM [Candidatus Dormibacteraeota bacterium]|nr:ribosome maturation factor RimM [Candidatus Dormibacteraeota bacterium]
MSTPRAAAPTRLRAAFVRRVHGVRGEVRVEPCGGDWRRFTRGLRMRVEPDGPEVTVRSARDGGDGSVLLALDEVTDAQAASALRGRYLDVSADQARRLDADEWFTWQLVGLRVASPDGAELGVISDVEPEVSSDVLVVRGPDGVRRYPMVRAFVKAVDIDAGTVTLEPLEETGS